MGRNGFSSKPITFAKLCKKLKKRDVKAAEVAAVVFASVAIVFNVVAAVVDDLDINVVIGLFHFDVAAAIQ